MNTVTLGVGASIDKPMGFFLFGLAVAMLALWFPFIPNWQTFIHMWRVEIAASILLLGTFAYLAMQARKRELRVSIPLDELKLIILPLTALIVWSGLSAFWGQSWKSALHHTFVWTEYLALYLIFRHMLERGRNFSAILGILALTLVLYAIPAIFEFAAFLTYGGTTTLGMRFAKYGEQVVTIFPLLLVVILSLRGKRFAAGACVLTLLALLIYCGFGRANLLLFIALNAAMLVIVIAVKRYRVYAPKFALLISLFVIAPVPLQLFSLNLTEGGVSPLTRFTDEQVTTGSSNFRKLMASLAIEMLRSDPVKGIGAANFGVQVNDYRREYGAANPTDVNLGTAEDAIPENTHNELLQIGAELGAVGLIIVALLIFGIGVYATRAVQRLGHSSLYPVAALIGLAGFLASSLVSAYSFRSMQNGIVFFFVLAVAAKSLRKRPGRTNDRVAPILTPSLIKLALCVGIVACLGLLTLVGLRLGSSILTARANGVRSTDAAASLYQLAMSLDDENPDVRQNLGMRLFRRKRYAESVPHLESAVRMGRAPAAEMSYLATAKTLSGDEAGAEEVMRTAAELYPRSAFVLTRYSTLLESRGNMAEAEEVFQRAAAIDRRRAETWRAMIKSGPKVLSEMAARDPAYMQIGHLTPESYIHAIVTERYIRFPEEQRFSLFKPVMDEE